MCLNGTYAGQPSNVDTVKSVNMAFATLSKWNEFLSHNLFSTIGFVMSPS